MAEWREIKRLRGTDPSREVRVISDGAGLFRFEPLRWLDPEDVSDEARHGAWIPSRVSGFYATAEEAEAAAREALPWLGKLDTDL